MNYFKALLLLLSMLLISRSMHLRKICFLSLCSIDKMSFPSFFNLQLPHLSPSIFFCSANHQSAVFVFYSFSLLSSVLQWHHQGVNFFSEYDQSNCVLFIRLSLHFSVRLSFLFSYFCDTLFTFIDN